MRGWTVDERDHKLLEADKYTFYKTLMIDDPAKIVRNALAEG